MGNNRWPKRILTCSTAVIKKKRKTGNELEEGRGRRDVAEESNT
jgi:hypothetical protein